MKTQMINYRKHFSTNSGYGEAAGWKTIVLPFDVKEISYERDGYNEKTLLPWLPSEVKLWRLPEHYLSGSMNWELMANTRLLQKSRHTKPT